MSKFAVLIFVATGAGLSLLGKALSSPADQPQIGPKLAQINKKLFNDMDLVNKGQLGMSREPAFDTHGGYSRKALAPIQTDLIDFRKKVVGQGYTLQEALIQKTPKIAKQAKQFPRSKTVWDYSIGCIVLREGEPRPLTSRIGIGLEKDSRSDKLVWKLYNGAKSKPFSTKEGDYTVYAAPIKYLHTECLSCHKDHKLGDTAAVYVAMYGKSKKMPPLQSPYGNQ